MERFNRINQGSVSVFFALTMVVLLSFLLAMFDLTRIQMISLEAATNYETAANMALAQYDPYLFQRFGLLAGERGNNVGEVVKQGLEISFYPETAKQKEYIMDYLLEQSTIDIFNRPKLRFMQPQAYTAQIDYQPYITSDFYNLKQQIHRYMEVRKEYIMVKPLLDKFDFFSATTKSGQMIEQKNQVVQALDQIFDQRADLMCVLDGVDIISNQKWQPYEGVYLRQIYVETAPSYQYFPDTEADIMASRSIDFSGLGQQLGQALEQIDDRLEAFLMGDSYEALEHYYPADGVYVLEPQTITEYRIKDWVFDDIAELQAQAQERIDRYLETLFRLEQYATTIEAAIAMIEQITVQASQSRQEIIDFQTRIQSENDVIQEVKQAIDLELNQIKAEIGYDQDSMSLVDNLILIKQHLEHNLNLALQFSRHTQLSEQQLQDYVLRRYNMLRSASDHEPEALAKIDQQMMAAFDGGFFGHINQSRYNQEVNPSVVRNLQRGLEELLSRYHNNLYLDYRQMSIQMPEFDYKAKIDQKQGFDFVTNLIQNGIIEAIQGPQIDRNRLPSVYAKADQAHPLSEFEQLEGSRLDWIQIKKKFIDQLYINEYIVGMFSNIAKSINHVNKTLNGYQNDNFLVNEVEYVITGDLQKQTAMGKIAAGIIGIRLLCNSIHLMTDATKTGMINSASTAIAGWWTGGAGTVIISAVIIGLWAYYESVIDVYMLLSGERVAFLKTPSTWYSSLEGKLDDLIVTTVKNIENQAGYLASQGLENYQKGRQQLERLITGKMSEWLDTGADYYKDLISGFEMELKQVDQDYSLTIEYKAEQSRNHLHQYLDQVLIELKQSQIETYHQPKITYDRNSTAYDICQQMAEQAYQAWFSLPIEERTRMKMLDIKEQIIESQQTKIDQVIDQIKNQSSQRFNQIVEEQLQIYGDSVDLSVKLGKKLGKKEFRKLCDGIRQEVKSYAGQIKTGSAKPQSQTDLLTELFGLTYEDYLRLFLSSGLVDEKTKLARIADLVQLNLGRQYDDFSISLDDYFIGLTVSGEITIDAIYLPPNLNQAWRQRQIPIKPKTADYLDREFGEDR